MAEGEGVRLCAAVRTPAGVKVLARTDSGSVIPLSEDQLRVSEREKVAEFAKFTGNGEASNNTRKNESQGKGAGRRADRRRAAAAAAGKCGLQNLGATCHMNALLQVLAHLPPGVWGTLDRIDRESFSNKVFYHRLTARGKMLVQLLGARISNHLDGCTHLVADNIDIEDDILTEARTLDKLELCNEMWLLHMRFSMTLKDLIADMWKEQPRALNPLNVHELISMFKPTFENVQEHQDCAEVLSRVLELLHGPVVELYSETYDLDTKKPFGPVVDNFMKRLEERKKSVIFDHFFYVPLWIRECCCGAQARVRLQAENTLTLPLHRSSKTLLDCMIDLTSPQKVDAQCDECGQNSQNCVEKTFIYSLPNVMVMQLKRFTNQLEKIEQPITFLKRLFMVEEGGTQILYDLHAVIKHRGTLKKGHYWAECKMPDGTWVCFDDEQVYDLKGFPSHEHAYILFYVRHEEQAQIATGALRSVSANKESSNADGGSGLLADWGPNPLHVPEDALTGFKPDRIVDRGQEQLPELKDVDDSDDDDSDYIPTRAGRAPARAVRGSRAARPPKLYANVPIKLELLDEDNSVVENAVAENAVEVSARYIPTPMVQKLSEKDGQNHPAWSLPPSLLSAADPNQIEAQKKELHTLGWTVFRGTVSEAVDEIVEAAVAIGRTGTPILNQREPNANGRRLQAHLAGHDLFTTESFLRLRREVERTLCEAEITTRQHKSQDWVVLHSEPGCPEQLPHSDFNIDQLKDETGKMVEEGKMPYLVIIGLQASSLIVWDESVGDFNHPISPSVVHIGRGDIFVFRPDLIHAGASYENENTRLHCFMEVEGAVSRLRGEETTFQPEEDNDLIIAHRPSKKKRSREDENLLQEATEARRRKATTKKDKATKKEVVEEE